MDCAGKVRLTCHGGWLSIIDVTTYLSYSNLSEVFVPPATTLPIRAAQSAASATVLDAIRDSDCNLAIWERAPGPDFAPLTQGNPQDLRFEASLADLPASLRAGLKENGFGGGADLHAALVADAALLAGLFCRALDLARFELRLEVVRTDSCRKFHADYVRARLITTYVGEGTDWLEADDAARVAAGGAARRINRLGTFDVGLFKGKLATDRPAIHRSPPIADTGSVRLLMVLNPVHKQFVDPAISGFSPSEQVA